LTFQTQRRFDSRLATNGFLLRGRASGCKSSVTTRCQVEQIPVAPAGVQMGRQVRTGSIPHLIETSRQYNPVCRLLQGRLHGGHVCLQQSSRCPDLASERWKGAARRHTFAPVISRWGADETRCDRDRPWLCRVALAVSRGAEESGLEWIKPRGRLARSAERAAFENGHRSVQNILSGSILPAGT
jgi:hypothetical protein